MLYIGVTQMSFVYFLLNLPQLSWNIQTLDSIHALPLHQLLCLVVKLQ